MNNSGRVGRETELKAWLWLVRQGFDVFDNIFPNGPVDTVAVNRETGETILFEIRTGSPVKGGYGYARLSEKQIRMGVQLLLYKRDVDEFEIMDAERAAPRPAKTMRLPAPASRTQGKTKPKLDWSMGLTAEERHRVVAEKRAQHEIAAILARRLDA